MAAVVPIKVMMACSAEMLSLGAAGAGTKCLGQGHCPSPVIIPGQGHCPAPPAIPVHSTKSSHPCTSGPLHVPALHMGSYPTVLQPTVSHVPLKGKATTSILATR